MLRIFALSIGMLSAVARADFYEYPDRVDLDMPCEISTAELNAIESRFSHPDSGPDGVARASAATDNINPSQICIACPADKYSATNNVGLALRQAQLSFHIR